MLFNVSRANHLEVSPVVSDDDHRQQVSWWLNGRLCGYYVSLSLPWRRRLQPRRRDGRHEEASGRGVQR